MTPLFLIAEPGTLLHANSLFGISSVSSAVHSTGKPAGPETIQCERPLLVGRAWRTLDMNRVKFR